MPQKITSKVKLVLMLVLETTQRGSNADSSETQSVRGQG